MPSGVNFTNVLLAAFAPRSQKDSQVDRVFFALLGFAYAKAAREISFWWPNLGN